MAERPLPAHQDYRQRFLDLLEGHERLESDASRRVAELAALLGRLSRSLLVSGHDELARRIERLSRALDARPLDPTLGREVRSLHERLLEFLTARDSDARALVQGLQRVAEDLEGHVASRGARRALKRFRRRLKGAAEPPGQLVADFAELHRRAMEGLGSAVANVQTEADSGVDFSPQQVPDDVSTPAPEAPTAPASAPGDGQVGPTGSAQSSCESVTVAPDLDVARAQLACMLERLEIPAALRSEAGVLEKMLADTAFSEAELVACLERLGALIDRVLAGLRVDYRGFLDVVDRRLDDLLSALGSVDATERTASAERRALTGRMHQRLSELKDEALQATELDALKCSIENHLERLMSSLNGLVTQEDSSAAARELQLEAMRERLSSLESESAEARRQLETQRRLALTDPLTGIANRAGFDEQLEQALAERGDRTGPIALAMADIDHFKRVNDEHGHQAGDRALSLVANIVRSRIRATDVCARFGGEEFVVLFLGADLDTAARIADQLRAFVESCGFNHQGRHIPLTISFGVSEFRVDDEVEAVIARADEALYAAKRAGRNRVETC